MRFAARECIRHEKSTARTYSWRWTAAWLTQRFCQVLGLGRTALWRTRAAYRQGGLEYALHDEARPGQPRKYQTDEEAEVVALACSAPSGRAQTLTIRLLTAAAHERPGLANVNRETVRQMLKKTIANPGAS